MNDFFGTDGVRGKVGKEPITADFFLKLGWAVGSVIAKEKNANVIIGKDTRVSGYLFESALEAGFLSAGVDVGLLGPMPTPAIAYLTLAYSATIGVVISASHNHFQDNGVKFFSAKGFKLSDKTQKDIEKKLSETTISANSYNIGKAIRQEQSLGRYIEFCKSTFERSFNLSVLNIVIDCAHGATYHIAHSVFSELGANITVINDKPDGFNINLKCGTTDTEHLKQTVIDKKADLGIAFDGDGDRVIMIDDSGEVVDGDELVFIIAKSWKNQNKLKNNIVVGTKMTNLGARRAFSDCGINFIEADVGDRFVMEQMKLNGAILGGESSGHIICLNKTTSGDGIISALQVLEALVKTHKSLAELKLEMTKYPQLLTNIKTKNRINLSANQNLKQAKLRIEKKLGNNGRVLVRQSGTEMVVRIMVESKDWNLVQKSTDELVDIINSQNY